jgi:hypothetical protein
MTDYQRVVDELRSLISANDLTQTDLLKQLTAAYTEACREANQRLRRAEEFLKRGLRSEAIHYAQAEQPTLLDLVAMLDFPELNVYQELLGFYGIPVPPKLMLATAEALNQAYAEEQPLEDLLRRHRRLALARAPLNSRLELMRAIAKLDKQNPVWQDDIRDFEAARFHELQTEVSRALDRGSRDGIAGIAEELAFTPWIVPPPAGLSHQVSAITKQATLGKARAELEEIVAGLNSAMARTDLARAQDLRDRYKKVVVVSELPANDSLLRRAQLPLQWTLQQEQSQAKELEFQNALAVLENALREKADPEEVIDHYHAALRHGLTIPGPLRRRYTEYVSEASRSRRWHEYAILLAILLAGLVVIMGLIGFFWLKGRVPDRQPSENTGKTELNRITGELGVDSAGDARWAVSTQSFGFSR